MKGKNNNNSGKSGSNSSNGNRNSDKHSDPIVERFLRFQSTGATFDLAWEGVKPIVLDSARKALKKLRIKVWTAYGEWAIDDVASMSKLRLLELGQPGAGGRFDPAKTKSPGISGFKGWLWKVVYSQAVDWARDNRNVGERKLFLEGDLACNDPSGDGESESFLKQVPAKIERAALLPLLDEVIGQLEDPLMREAVRLKLHEDLSHEETGKRLGVSDTTIQRRLKAAYAILGPLLEERGFHEGWLAA